MEWKNMNYACWINADDEEIDICEMDNEYIKNCIQCIQKSDYKHFTREDAMKDKEQKIFGPWWCYEHAQNYLDAFNTELSIRKKGKKQDYPEINLEETCDNCQKNILCESNGVCDKWKLNLYVAFDKFSGEDLEVARRYGFYCNNTLYYK